jgi:hypothetical protein
MKIHRKREKLIGLKNKFLNNVNWVLKLWSLINHNAKVGHMSH